MKLPQNKPADYNFFKEDLGAKGKPHEFIDNEYVEKPYVFQEFPKMLYHPDYGKSPAPRQERYSAGAHSPEQLQAALIAYNEAFAAWQKQNRTKIAPDKKEEDRLAKKGWLLKPPVHANQSAAAFDLHSDEI